MIIFLYGPDTYRSRRKLNEIIEQYKKIHKSGLNLRCFDGESLDFQDFKDEIQSVSMFAEKKLIILRNTIKNEKGFKDSFLAEIKRFVNSDDAILFYEEKEMPKGDSLAKILKKAGKSQEFKLLEGQQLKNWVRKEFAGYRAEINSGAVEKLIDSVGNDLWQLSNEIKKLVDYKNKKKIETNDIELLVKPKIETDIFKTIDSLASKNKKQALELIHRHLQKGEHPLYLLSMINFQFRNLLTIKNLSEKYQSPYALSKITHLHPYLVKKNYTQAQKFSLGELKKIYQKIFEVDLSVKTGRLGPEAALDLLIAEI